MSTQTKEPVALTCPSCSERGLRGTADSRFWECLLCDQSIPVDMWISWKAEQIEAAKLRSLH